MGIPIFYRKIIYFELYINKICYGEFYLVALNMIIRKLHAMIIVWRLHSTSSYGNTSQVIMVLGCKIFLLVISSYFLFEYKAL